VHADLAAPGLFTMTVLVRIPVTAPHRL
jgi:hypothetical protein